MPFHNVIFFLSSSALGGELEHGPPCLSHSHCTSEIRFLFCFVSSPSHWWGHPLSGICQAPEQTPITLPNSEQGKGGRQREWGHPPDLWTSDTGPLQGMAWPTQDSPLYPPRCHLCIPSPPFPICRWKREFLGYLSLRENPS